MTEPASPSPRKSLRASAPSWLSRAAAHLLGRKKTPSPPLPEKSPPTRPIALTKSETALLPPFAGLPLDRIHVPKTKAECATAAAEILALGRAGFDTESRPTFTVGEKSTGPHVVQFALTDKAFIFQLCRPECLRVAADLIASPRVLKIGFGLRNDHSQIQRRLGVKLHHVLDLDQTFRKKGYRGQIGVRAAIGAVLQRSFPKSKSTTTSNWAAPTLTPRQLTYAANDAFAALKIMEALDLEQPVTKRPKRPARNS
jgi:hypothetical protein